MSSFLAPVSLFETASRRRQPAGSPGLSARAAAAWIGAAYWFTASTSFANPAITLARSLSDTFAGIRLADAPFFMAAQFIGAMGGLAAAQYLFSARRTQPAPR